MSRCPAWPVVVLLVSLCCACSGRTLPAQGDAANRLDHRANALDGSTPEPDGLAQLDAGLPCPYQAGIHGSGAFMGPVPDSNAPAALLSIAAAGLSVTVTHDKEAFCDVALKKHPTAPDPQLPWWLDLGQLPFDGPESWTVTARCGWCNPMECRFDLYAATDDRQHARFQGWLLLSGEALADLHQVAACVSVTDAEGRAVTINVVARPARM